MIHKYSHGSVSLDNAFSMLQCIPAIDRDMWLKVGMAIKWEFGEKGWGLFDAWSHTADNYNPQAAKSVWQSLNGSGVTIGTLVYLAKEYGYRGSCASRQSSKPGWPQRAAPRPTSDYAKQLFLGAIKDDQSVANHPYAKSKGIHVAAGAGRGIASGKLIGKNADCLIVPIRHLQSNRVQGVQVINTQGIKQTFGQLSSGACILGDRENLSATWYVVEGWASAVSVVFDHGKDVCACSFGKSSQNKIAKIIAESYQPNEVVIYREVD